ncbi:MAG: LptF/LptG family permease, partial [Gemmatimonadales bacterium]
MARPTVRILSRYILRQHLPPLGYALAALTFAMLVNQVAKQFGNFVGKGLPGTVIFEVFALSIPFIVAMTLPMAVLVAVLYTFSHLAADNEVTAMKASGISVGRLLAPVMGGALLMALISLVWNDQVLPRSNHELRTLLVDIQRKKPTFQLKEQVINEVVPGQFFLRAARIDPVDNSLNDVTIYDLEDPERRRIITADSGRMAYTPGGTDLYLTLRDGEVHEVKRTAPDQFNRTFYATNRIRVAGVSNTFEETEKDDYRGDREMTICAMQEVVTRARQDLERVRREALAAVSGELRRLGKLAPLPPRAAAADSMLPGPRGYCAVVAALK